MFTILEGGQGRLGPAGEMKVCLGPPPLHSNRRGEGTVTFRFANLLRRLGVALLLCVCWLDKVVFLVHCCISDLLHPRYSTVPCIMQNTSFRNFSHG